MGNVNKTSTNRKSSPWAVFFLETDLKPSERVVFMVGNNKLYQDNIVL
jgi:hypothetical protein